MGQGLRQHLSRRGPLLLTAAAVAALGIKFFYFISAYSVNVLYFDQWDLFTPLFQGKAGPLNLFLWQHGWHRMGLGLIGSNVLYAATNWNTRAESFMIGGCIFAALIIAIWLKKQLYGCISYFDVAIPLIFLNLMQYEMLIGTPNPGFSAIPLLLILLYCAILLLQNSFLRYALLLTVSFCLIYTGFGLFMGPVTIGVFALYGYWRVRRMSETPLWLSLAGLALAGVSLGSFFIHYTFNPAAVCFDSSHKNFGSYSWFVALMFSAFLGPTRPVVLVTVGGFIGLSVALGILAIELYRVVTGAGNRPGNRAVTHVIVGVLVGYSMLFAVNAAFGRVCLGLPDAAQASRYSTPLIPAYLGVYLFLAALPSMPVRGILMACFVFLLIPSGIKIPPSASRFTDGKRAWVGCYLRTADIAYCDRATGFPVYPPPQQNGMQQKLDYLSERRLNFFR